MPVSVRPISVLLLICVQLLSFSEVTRGSIYCQDIATGIGHIDSSAEQMTCHGLAANTPQILISSQDCIDTPVGEIMIADQHRAINPEWAKAISVFPLVPQLLQLSLPAPVTSQSVVDSAHDVSVDQDRVVLRSVILVI